MRKDAGRLETDRLKQESGPTDGRTSSAPEDKNAAAPAAPPPPATLAARQAARSANALDEKAAVGNEIVSPDPGVRWRLSGSVVEHSTNGGSSWETVFNGLRSELTAGAAPSTSVCWVVGRGGVVLLSTDGRSFSRVAFPEGTDLSAVRASDARNASVSTTDGRIFNTRDGGARWERQ